MGDADECIASTVEQPLGGTGRSILEAGALPLPADVGIEGAEQRVSEGLVLLQASFRKF